MTQRPRPRALVFAYACEPDRGSEPGAGWGVVRTLSHFADCLVLVGPEHEPKLHEWKRHNPDDRLEFVTVGEPPWASLVPKTRIGRFVAYLGWLRQAGAYARALPQRSFDFVWHATYSTYWLPTPAATLPWPFVWGPVGGAVTSRPSLWCTLPLAGKAGEVADLIAVRMLAALPATRRTWVQARVVLVQNAETLAQLPPGIRRRAVVLNHALFTSVEKPSMPRGTDCLFIGSLEPRKAPALALHALAASPPDVRLTIAGDGPSRPSLERLARRLGVDGRVTFAGPVSHIRALELMAAARAVVFTGVREEGGIALAEAMCCGVPVVVLGHGGAATVARATLDPARVALVPPGTRQATIRGLAVGMTHFSRAVQHASSNMLDRGAAVSLTASIVASLVAGRDLDAAASRESVVRVSHRV